MSELKTQSPTDIHVETVRAAIMQAETEPERALNESVYMALAALEASTNSNGQFQILLHELSSAHPAFSKSDIRKQIAAVRQADGPTLPGGSDELREGVEPWPDPVDGGDLYTEVYSMVSRHCVLSEQSKTAVTLWVMASYSINSFRIFPKLLVHSPQKRCGKTTLLEILQGLMPQALSGSNVTPSVIFRAIELWGVSILLDEVDTFLHNSDDLRGIVNSGHTRSGAYVWRTEGDAEKEPRRFSTWAPMVLAMIGNPPGTVMDRSVRVGLVRKTTEDRVDRIPQSYVDDALPIRQRLKRWADDNAADLRTCTPIMPSHDNDRAVDNWTALFSVADSVGRRPDAEAAILDLERVDDDADDLSIELLKDIQELIEIGYFTGAIPSARLVERLNEMDDRPWPECNRGKPLSANKLAFLLKPYGIKAKNRRTKASVGKGSRAVKTLLPEDFDDSFSRYLVKPPQFSNKVAETASKQALSRYQSENQDSNVTEQHEQFSNDTNLKSGLVT